MATYDVAPAPMEGDRFPVYQVLRTDLVPAPGGRRKPRAGACRYYQARMDAQTGELLVRRLPEEGEHTVPVTRRVRQAAGRLWCSCGYTHDCPHRQVWRAMGLPEGEQ